MGITTSKSIPVTQETNLEIAKRLIRRIHGENWPEKAILEQQASALYSLAASIAERDHIGKKKDVTEESIHQVLQGFTRASDLLEYIDKCVTYDEATFQRRHCHGDGATAKINLDSFATGAYFAVSATSEDGPRRESRLLTLSRAKEASKTWTDDPDGINASAAFFQRKVQEFQEGSTQHIEHLMNLTIALMRRAIDRTSAEDAKSAIEAGEQVLRQTPKNDPARLERLERVSMPWELYYILTEDVAGLGRSALILEEMVALAAPNGHARRSQWLKRWRVGLESIFQHSSEGTDLTKWFNAIDVALSTTASGDPMWSDLMQSLGRAREAKYHLTHDPHDLDDWIKTATEAANTVPVGHELRTDLLGSVSAAAALKYKLTMDPNDLAPFGLAEDEAGLNFLLAPPKPSSHDTGFDNVEELRRIIDRVRVLTVQAETSGDPKDWEKCVAEFRPALSLSMGFIKPQVTAQLIEYVCRQSRASGDSDLARQALEMTEEALRSTPESVPNRHYLLSQLTDVFELIYDQDGQGDAIRAAISACQEAVEASRSDRALHVKYMVQLLDLLSKERERAGGGRETLDTVLSQLDPEVVKGMLPLRELCGYLNHLDDRYLETGNPDDQEAAYIAARQVVSKMDEGTVGAWEIEVILKVHNSRLGRKREPFDLDQCIKYTNLLLERDGRNPKMLPQWLPVLSGYYLHRFELSQDESDITAAITAADRAYEIPDSVNKIDAILLARGKAYRKRYELNGVPTDAECALSCFERIPQDAPGNGPEAAYELSIILYRDLERDKVHDKMLQVSPRLRKIANAFINIIKHGNLEPYVLILRVQAVFLMLDVLGEWEGWSWRPARLSRRR